MGPRSVALFRRLSNGVAAHRALDALRDLGHTAASTEYVALIGTSSQRSTSTEIRRQVEVRTGDAGEWTREPPDRTEATSDQVGSGAERQRYRAAPVERRRA